MQELFLVALRICSTSRTKNLCGKTSFRLLARRATYMLPGTRDRLLRSQRNQRAKDCAMFTFHDLEMRFGPAMAYQCLVEIEKAARLRPCEFDVDPEARLAAAIRAQDAQVASVVFAN